MPGDPQWGVLYQANRNVAGNGFADVNAGEPIDANAPGVLNLQALGEPDFLSFGRNLDRNLHGTVHDLVGNATNMGYVPTAAQDPIFWLHHANIDRIWFAWTAAGGSNPTSFGDRFTFTKADGTPAVVALSTVANHAALDYRYDVLPTPPLKVGRATARAGGALQVLLSSARGRGLQAAAPVRLGAAPSVIPLRPVVTGGALAALHGAIGPARLRLVVHGVAAAAPPGTLFGLYLGLPVGVAPNTPAAARFRIGVLNFFDAVAMPGMADMGGRDYLFELDSAAARRLGAAAGSAVTVAAFGSPAAESMPIIGGTLEIVRP